MFIVKLCWPIVSIIRCARIMIIIPCHFRSGKDWRRARSASNNQIKPSNVQTHTSGVSDVIASFVDYIGSTRDGDGRISDIKMPIRRLITSSKI